MRRLAPEFINRQFWKGSKKFVPVGHRRVASCEYGGGPLWEALCFAQTGVTRFVNTQRPRF